MPTPPQIIIVPLALSIVGILGAAVPGAQAQYVAVTPSTGDTPEGQNFDNPALQELVEQLKKESFVLMLPKQVQRNLQNAFGMDAARHCPGIQCTNNLFQLKTRPAIDLIVSIQQHRDHGNLIEVTIEMRDRRGNHVTATKGTGFGLPFAVREAVEICIAGMGLRGKERKTLKPQVRRTSGELIALLPIGGDLKKAKRGRKKMIRQSLRGVRGRVRHLKHRLHTHDEVKPELKKYHGASCEDLGCAQRVFEALPEVDIVLEVRVAVHGRRPIAVVAEALRRDGRRGKSTQKVSRKLGKACADAVDQAIVRSTIQNTRGVHFTGAPKGAVVIVGGRPLGNLPLTAVVPVGRQSLVIKHADFPTHTSELDVPGGDEDYKFLVNLPKGFVGPHPVQPADNRALASGPPGSGRTLFNTVGPVTLGLAGAASVGIGIVGMTLGEDCTERDNADQCVSFEERNTALAIGYMAAGVLAVTGAVVWFALTPGGGVGDNDGERLRAGVGPNRIILKGTF